MRRCLLSVILASGLAAVAVGEEELGFTTLTERNPFIHSGFTPPEDGRPTGARPTPVATQEFAFQGVYELGDQTHVLVKDRRQPNGQWLVIGEDSDGLTAKSFDSEENRLLLASASGEHWLDLASAPNVSIAAAPRPSTRPAVTGTSPTRRIQPTSNVRSPTRIQPPRTRTVRPSNSTSTTTRRLPSRLPRSSIPQATDPDLRAPRYTPPSPIGLQPPPGGVPDFRPTSPP